MEFFKEYLFIMENIVSKYRKAIAFMKIHFLDTLLRGRTEIGLQETRKEHLASEKLSIVSTQQDSEE